MGNRLQDLTGQTFGQWLVIERAVESTRKSGPKWRCSCLGCGREGIIFGGHLRSGRSKSCGCSKRTTGSPNWRGYGDISGAYFARLQYMATSPKMKRGILPFEVTIEYIWDLFLRQNKCCALSGIPLSFPTHSSDLAMLRATASLDRIDSAQGYIPGNVQWVHKHINFMKRTFSQEYFIDMCKKVSDFNV